MRWSGYKSREAHRAGWVKMYLQGEYLAGLLPGLEHFWVRLKTDTANSPRTCSRTEAFRGRGFFGAQVRKPDRAALGFIQRMAAAGNGRSHRRRSRFRSDP